MSVHSSKRWWSASSLGANACSSLVEKLLEGVVVFSNGGGARWA